jgi:hypothetical protein
MPEVALHPLLQYSQHDVGGGHCCSILWDFREQPLTSVRHISSFDTPLSEFELSQHATSPPLTLLHITCDVLPERWSIEARNLQGVTMRDVLEAIFISLNAQLKLEEWERLCLKQRDRISVVFDARWRASMDPRNVWTHGVARVDCLLQHTWFAGLTMSLEGQDICILTLRRPR